MALSINLSVLDVKNMKLIDIIGDVCIIEPVTIQVSIVYKRHAPPIAMGLGWRELKVYILSYRTSRSVCYIHISSYVHVFYYQISHSIDSNVYYLILSKKCMHTGDIFTSKIYMPCRSS